MAAIRVQQFGGMVPAVDDRLLPESAAARSQSTILLDGSLRGFRPQASVFTMVDSNTKRVYRIPNDFKEKVGTGFTNSTWMEFLDIDTDVVRNPTVNDLYNRFYWTSPSTGPRYNSLSRIQAGQQSYLLGVPYPTTAPGVTASGGVAHAISIILEVAGGGYAVGDVLQATGGTGTEATFTVTAIAADPGTSPPTGAITGIEVKTQGSYSVFPPNPVTLTAGTGTGAVGTLSSDVVTESRAYVYTWVSSFGEEGAPSVPTVVNGKVNDAWAITMTAPTSPQATDRNLATTRIYRTVVSTQGVATYFFVAEVSLGTLSYNDTITDDVVSSNNQLQSTTWIPPSTSLAGVVELPNGILAGWSGSDVYFCEPFRPHAWPAQYASTVDAPIVGMGVFGQSVIVLTTGYPYIFSGIHPAQMSQSKIAVLQPCLARASIMSTQTGVYYASQDGLVNVSSGGVTLFTKDLLEKATWLNDVDPYSLRAVPYRGAYLAYSAPRGAAGTGILIDAMPIAFNWIADTHATKNLQVDKWSGEIFVIRDGAVWRLDPVTVTNYEPYLWRSKVFETPYVRNLGAAKILFSVPAGTASLNSTPNSDLVQTLASDQYGLFRLYADGTLIYTREIRASGEIFKLPSGFKATMWQFEVEARVRIFSVELGASARDLRSV